MINHINITKIGLFSLFLFAMYPWFIWNNRIFLISTVLMTLYSIVLFILNNNMLSVINNRRFVCCLTLLCLWTSLSLNFFGFLQLTMTCIIMIMVCKLSYDNQIEVLSFITKWTSILLGISLIAYILFLLGLFKISPDHIIYRNYNYESLNYYFFIIPLDQQFSSFWRFKAFLMEPGHMMLGVIPLIYANNFNFRNKYVLMLIIVVLFSFSLAGYITLFIGYILLKSKQNALRDLFIGLISVIILYVIATHFGINTYFDDLILGRLNFDEGISENTRRTTAAFDINVFDKAISDPFTMLFGTGEPLSELIAKGGGAGYKPYWVQLGLLGLLLVLFTYTSYLNHKSTREIKVFTLVLLLLLAQDSYPTWFSLLIPYVLGMNNLKTVRNEYLV